MTKSYNLQNHTTFAVNLVKLIMESKRLKQCPRNYWLSSKPQAVEYLWVCFLEYAESLPPLHCKLSVVLTQDQTEWIWLHITCEEMGTLLCKLQITT